MAERLCQRGYRLPVLPGGIVPAVLHGDAGADGVHRRDGARGHAGRGERHARARAQDRKRLRRQHGGDAGWRPDGGIPAPAVPRDQAHGGAGRRAQRRPRALGDPRGPNGTGAAPAAARIRPGGPAGLARGLPRVRPRVGPARLHRRHLPHEVAPGELRGVPEVHRRPRTRLLSRRQGRQHRRHARGGRGDARGGPGSPHQRQARRLDRPGHGHADPHRPPADAAASLAEGGPRGRPRQRDDRGRRQRLSRRTRHRRRADPGGRRGRPPLRPLEQQGDRESRRPPRRPGREDLHAARRCDL